MGRFVVAVLVLVLCLGLVVVSSAAMGPQPGQAGGEGLRWVGQYVWVDPGGNLRHSSLLWEPVDGR